MFHAVQGRDFRAFYPVEKLCKSFIIKYYINYLGEKEFLKYMLASIS